MIRLKLSQLYLGLLVLTFLAAHAFFNPFGVIEARTNKFLFYLSSVVVLGFALLSKNRIDKGFSKAWYGILMLSIIGSIVMASMFHEQAWSVSFVVTLPYLFGYSYLYVLFKFKPRAENLDYFWKLVVVVSGIIYLANLTAFPDKIFGESMNEDEYDMSRGFARIGVSMILFVCTAFYYFLNRWMEDGKRKWWIWIGISIVLIVMSLTRQFIFLSFLFGGLFILRSASWSKRIAVLLASLFFAYYVLPQIPIYKTMMELSETQAERNKYQEDDIRIRAWRFYTYEFQTNRLSPIFGNGMPSFGNSPWGDHVEATVAASRGGNACYAVDVGWAGFYFYFGIFATAALILIITKGVLRKKSSDNRYLSYGLAQAAITSVASAPILYFNQITELSILIYLAYMAGKMEEGKGVPS